VDVTRVKYGASQVRWAQLAAVGAVLFWAAVLGWNLVGHDALTYLAAGERLNAGHPLYALGPGDRVVDTAPPYFGPLLSPPLIAVLFRPIALVGMTGMWAWTIGAGLAVTAAAWYVARSVAGLMSVLLLSFGLGIAAISGNVSSVFLLGYLAIWRWRDQPLIGVLIGVMGAVKLLPFVFVGFLVAGRRWRAIGWCAATVAVALAVSILGAGWDNTIAYLGVARDALPQPISLAYATGLPWLSPAILAAGTLGAVMMPERAAFQVCIVAIVLGAPVLTWREMAALIALTAPLATPGLGSWRADRPEGRAPRTNG
jgi:hypothetical protein